MASTKAEWDIFFDHAAIATADPGKLKKVFQVLGLEDGGQETVSSQGVITHFLYPQEPTQKQVRAAVEILEPESDQGPVAKFLQKKGPGIHHLSFRVSDIEKACEALKKEKIRLVYEKPQPGAHSTLVNFIHPESTGGLLLELSQKKSD